MPKTLLAFDLYGTLLSTSSIATTLSRQFPAADASSLALTFRKYQLEYTWRANSMGTYIPFDDLTRRALVNTLKEAGFGTPVSAMLNEVMGAYDGLDTFDEVGGALETLQNELDIESVVFSNGTQRMVSKSVQSSPSLAKYKDVFKDLITVEEVKKFKPHPEVYSHLARKVGKDPNSQMGEMWLISGNPFDVVGAKAVGMRACWVDRGEQGWCDAMIEGNLGKPDVIAKGLGEVVEKVKAFKA